MSLTSLERIFFKIEKYIFLWDGLKNERVHFLMRRRFMYIDGTPINVNIFPYESDYGGVSLTNAV